ncbi:Protein ALTERED XYLOGLUCAN like [Actinidia chinensis var. chinensis]|uniref:Protein ALTERED XYLOGLUCAN like n=1 Tax=Actinidia chinensis var. chinensis TaxID=1590841 RepID=A0A2R6RF47_ACTCC|nr:Protein ALTERED XYLOGLUCAN like [Actinidia chinensis var. chinensis]
MGSSSTNPFKGQTYHLMTKKLQFWRSYAFLFVALLCLYFFHAISPFLTANNHLSRITPTITTSSSSSSFPFKEEEERANVEIACNYTYGKWVHDKLGPLYNGTTCGTITDAQNCLAHGRPDLGYLYWKWKPNQCHLPRFEPKTFLQILRNKHLAFVGDSMARNQLESLLCMLATASTPNLVYSYSDGDKFIRHKFRRWHFPSHNVNVSIYWSPFLVKGIEKTESVNYNRLYLDSLDERWASALDQIDMIVLSAGHWFLQPAVYFNDNSVLGCHYCTGQNHTEVGFYDVFGKTLNTTLRTIIERRGLGSGSGIDVIVTTFSPHHFEGEWDKFGACPKTHPYAEGEKELEGMDAEMRKIGVREVEAAKVNAKKSRRLRLEVLDITKLSLMRGDGHAGPYMFANPFANGITERVQNDCVHWCLPGPVDAWNEILLDMMKRWERGLV